MSKQANPAKIGGFVLGAIALVVVGILVFTDARFFSQKDRFVVYFEGTVNGLKIGAPVKVKGVQVGQVTDIQVEFNIDKAVVRTPVFIEIDMSIVKVESSESAAGVSDLTYESLVRHGLRAKLKSQSLLTGQLYVEINFFPGTPIHLVGSNLQIPEIPALPSETEELINDVGIIITKLKNLPLNELFNSLLSTAENLEKFVSSPELIDNARKLDQILSTLQVLINRLNQDFGPLVNDIEGTISDTRDLINSVNQQVVPLARSTEDTLKQARESLLALEDMASEGSPMTTDFARTLNDLSEAARSIRTLADYLQRNPDALVYGKRGNNGD